MKDIQVLRRHSSRVSQSLTLKNKQGQLFTMLNLENREFRYHPVVHENFSKSKYLEKILAKVTDYRPESYEKFVSIRGVGPKTVRALALVAEMIYGAKPSYEDPARYSFAFGGKDATPYPVDRKTYDETIQLLKKALAKTTLSLEEKRKTARRLEQKT